MLNQDNRLKKVRDFNLLFSHGQWVKGHFIDLRYLNLSKMQVFCPKNANPSDFIRQIKIGFTVGLGISKIAVRRNKLKRALREAVRLLIKDGLIPGGCYALFVARSGSLDKSFAEVASEVNYLLSKAKIIK